MSTFAAEIRFLSRFQPGISLCVDIFMRTRTCADVPAANFDMKSISRNTTCGFFGEMRSVSRFQTETSTQKQFAQARPAFYSKKSTLCRRLPPNSASCRGFKRKPRHQIDLRRSSLRFRRTTPIFADVPATNLGSCRRFRMNSNSCRCFGCELRHKFDFQKADRRFLPGNPVCVDVCRRNPIFVEVLDRNFDTDLICLNATCGFFGEMHSMSRFQAETSTQKRFAGS